MGLPLRTTYRALGGTRTDAMKITRPDKEVGMSTWNEAQSIIAAASQLLPLVSLTVDDDGTRLAGREAWNDLDDIAKRVTITHDTTGVYVIAASATYPDWQNVEQPVEFTGVMVSPSSATSVRPPTWVIDSPTQVTVYTWNASGVATDMPFSIDLR